MAQGSFTYQMEELKARTVFLFGMLLCFPLWLAAQEAEVYTLQRCLDLAMKQNQTVLNSSIQVKSNDAVLQQARAAVLPSVSGYANQGISTGKSINPYTNAFINQEVGTGQYGINASLTLFSGLSVINAIRQQALAYEAGKLDEEQSGIDISIQVLLAYLQILNSEELINQATSQMAATQVQIDRLQVLQNNGAVNPSVLYDTRGQLANDRLSLIQARGAFVNAKLSLAQLLNHSFPENARFEKAELASLLEVALTEPTSSSGPSLLVPAVQASALRTTSALKRLYASRGGLLPTLSLNGSLASNYSSAGLSQQLTGSSDEATGAYVSAGGQLLPVYATRNSYQSQKIGFNSQVKNNFNSYVGLSLQLPLFNGLRAKTQVTQSRIAHRQAEVQEKTTAIRYASLIAQLVNEQKNAYERYEVVQQQVKDYEASFRIVTARFEQGSVTTFEYTTAKNNFDKASASLITVRYEYIFKGKALDLYRNGSHH